MLLLLQFLVVAFTICVWWLARRDLNRASIERNTPVVKEWDDLQKAVNSLIADLERRALAAEQRVSVAEQRLQLLIEDNSAADQISSGSTDLRFPPAPREAEPLPESEKAPVADPRYAEVYALADAGMTDVREIARCTGLECGEIELILTLRVRRPRI